MCLALTHLYFLSRYFNCFQFHHVHFYISLLDLMYLRALKKCFQFGPEAPEAVPVCPMTVLLSGNVLVFVIVCVFSVCVCV